MAQESMGPADHQGETARRRASAYLWQAGHSAAAGGLLT